MIKENFISSIIAKFRAPKDCEDPDGANRIFFKDVSDFADKCKPERLQDAYQFITQNHDYPTHFPMAFLYKRAKKEKWLAEKPKIKKVVWNVCNNCGVKYSIVGRGCPKCRSHSSILATPNDSDPNILPDDIIEVQEDCYYCTNYSETIKKENERKLYFQGCHEYGKKQDAQCSACECRECCRQMMMYNADPKGTTEKYKTTHLSQPWIKECEPLNETADMMLKHMRKTKFREAIDYESIK
jgi:hypothetical protein